MDIQEFWQLSLGRWFVQRTTHNFVTQQSVLRTGELSLESLNIGESRAVQVCHEANVDIAHAYAGIAVTWKEATLGHPISPPHTSILIAAAHGGRQLLLRARPLLVSRCDLGTDHVLTLTPSASEQQSSVERVWFASPNLRLRTTTIQSGECCLLSSFCSEVRLGVTSAPTRVATAIEA